MSKSITPADYKHGAMRLDLLGVGNTDDTALHVADCATGMEWGREATFALHTMALEAPLAGSPVHGVDHWLSVLRNGLCLLEAGVWDDGHLPANDKQEAADRGYYVATLYLFALCHDCRRFDEGRDLTHGAYGAAVLQQAMGAYGYDASNSEAMCAALLACNMHTVVDHPRTCPGYQTVLQQCPRVRRAVGLCLDADRLDLMRLGRPPHQSYLYHANAIDVAKRMLKAGAW